MPKKGWKSITIKTELIDELQKRAKQLGKTVPQYVEYLVEKAKKKESRAA
jgi:macrodomain Ter protein organizer (MatP/YcbG family)